MSLLIAVIAMAASVNPLRVWPGLPGRDHLERGAVATLGALLTIASVVGLAAVSAPVLGALDITDPTARIAAGIAVVVIGVRDVFIGPAQVEPQLEGRRAAIVPVFVPHLFGPGVALLAISAGADLGVGQAALAALVALVVVIVVASRPPPTGTAARLARVGHALTGALAIAIGAGLAVNGVFDI